MNVLVSSIKSRSSETVLVIKTTPINGNIIHYITILQTLDLWGAFLKQKQKTNNS